MDTAKHSWILAGYEIFAKEGHRGLQVEALARKVGKSKSSFYHYFVDLDIFTNALLEYHIEQAKALAYQMRQCKTFFPDVAQVFLEARQELFFNRQLRIHREILVFRQCFTKASDLVEEVFMPLWAEALGLSHHKNLAQVMLKLVSENFYLQITEETLTKEWFMQYISSVQKLVQDIHKAKRD